MKRYEPHCPSPVCKGGLKNKLYRIKGNPSWLPPEAWTKQKEEEILYRCAYCGLVWFQDRAKKPGFDARLVGYYDDSQHPWEFVSLKGKYRIRGQNTSRYWYNVGSKAVHPPKMGGVGYAGALVVDSEGNVLGSVPSEEISKCSIESNFE